MILDFFSWKHSPFLMKFFDRLVNELTEFQSEQIFSEITTDNVKKFKNF